MNKLETNMFPFPCARLTVVLCGIVLGAASMSAQTAAETAQKHAASVQKAKSSEADYLSGLASSVRSEKVDAKWASQKEDELRNSYSAEGLPSGALTSVECHSTKCALDVNLQPGSDPKELVDQQIAVKHWLSSTQSCGYTMATGVDPQKGPSSISIFITCAKQQ